MRGAFGVLTVSSLSNGSGPRPDNAPSGTLHLAVPHPRRYSKVTLSNGATALPRYRTTPRAARGTIPQDGRTQASSTQIERAGPRNPSGPPSVMRTSCAWGQSFHLNFSGPISPVVPIIQPPRANAKD